MKLTFTIGLSMLALSAAAQHQHLHDYDRSVFSGSQNAQPVQTSKTARMQQAWQAQLPGWMGDEDALTGNPRNIFGPKVAIPGATLNDKVQYCMQQLFPALGLNKSHWQQLPVTQSRKATYVRFRQVVAGHKVTFAQLSFRFTADNSGIVQIENRSYGAPDVSLVPAVTKAQALQAAIGDVTDATLTQNNVADEWVWFPIPGDEGYTMHPAWPFTANGNIDATPVELSGYVDAIDGKLLYRSNAVKETFDLTVKGSVYKNSLAAPPTLEPLANIELNIGANTYYTDALGVYNNSSLPAAANVTIPLEGKWSKVMDVPNNNNVPSVTTNVTTNGTTYTYNATGQATIRHINAYYHVNRVHDFMKTHLPSFTGMDFVLPTNVDVTGSCNAFYTGQGGGSINFYAPGNGCNSFAEIGDVIYHEYGHGISDKFYTAQSSSSIDNGALNEGNSDVWAMSITHSPIIGDNAYTGGGNIRRYDATPKVYPKDIEGEVHADGEIIAGAWWDVGVNMNDIDGMADIFTESYYSVPDGPAGTEGKVYYDVLIAALMSDDNDNNIANGTPHFTEIVSAFAKHGIYLMAGTTVTHTELAHQAAGAPITISATVSTSYPDYLQGLKVIYRKRGAGTWDTVTLNSTGVLTFSGQLPAFDKNDIVDYYFQVNDVFSQNNVYAPLGYNPANANAQNTIPYQFGVGIGVGQRTTFEDAVDGWSIGNNPGDNASGGEWIQAKPVPSYYQSQICQVGNDHTSGTGKCLVTGNATSPTARSSSADVDEGTTTVLTPIMNLSWYRNPIIEYYRWFSNDRGSNARNGIWTVQIRNAANNTWKNVEQTYQSDYNWRRRIFAVKEYMTTFDKVQLKFIANDPINNALPGQGQSTVEAAMDDFFIYDNEDALSVPELATKGRVNIYPNPADQSVRVVVPTTDRDGEIAVVDLTGRVITKIPVTTNVTDYNINTATLPAGTYMLLINSGHTIQTGKLSVMH